MIRARLADRRRSDSVDFTHSGLRWTASCSRFRDGGLAELFLVGSKAQSDLGILASDAAILLSIGLQYGMPADVAREAMLRSSTGAAASVVCHALDIAEAADHPDSR